MRTSEPPSLNDMQGQNNESTQNILINVDNRLQMEVTQGIIEATKPEHAHDDSLGFTSSCSMFSSSAPMFISVESSLPPNTQTHERYPLFQDGACPSESDVQETGDTISGAGDTSVKAKAIGAEAGNVTTGAKHNISGASGTAVGAVDNQGDELRSPDPNHAKVSNEESEIFLDTCMISVYHPDRLLNLNASLKAEIEPRGQNQNAFKERAEAKAPLSYTAISLEEARNVCDQATALSLDKSRSAEAIGHTSEVSNEEVVRGCPSNALISTASAGAHSGLSNQCQQGVSP